MDSALAIAAAAKQLDTLALVPAPGWRATLLELAEQLDRLNAPYCADELRKLEAAPVLRFRDTKRVRCPRCGVSPQDSCRMIAQPETPAVNSHPLRRRLADDFPDLVGLAHAAEFVRSIL